MRARRSTAPEPSAPAAAVPSAAASGQPAIVARYVVDAQWDDGFQAEVDVANHGSAPVSGWQIVVVLPHDQVTSVRNAAGYVSHHILLLYQPSSSPALMPGSTLRVFLTVAGLETTPELCAFDNTTCG